LGGGEVPVSDSESRSTQKKIQTNSAQIQRDQDALVKKACVQDVAVRRARQVTTARMTATSAQYAASGRDGGPIFETRPPAQQEADTHTIVLNNTIARIPALVTPSLVRVTQQNLVGSGRTIAQVLQCPIAQRGIDPVACARDYNSCGSTADERWRNSFDMNFYPGCTQEGVDLVLGTYQASVERQANGYRTQLLAQGQGYLPNLICPGAVTQEECLVLQTGSIVTPGNTQKTILERSLASGQVQQENANEIGALVDNLFSELATTAFTSLRGVIGIALQNSNGQGSYADNLRGNTTEAALGQARLTLAGQIQNSLDIESEYHDTLADMLINLANTKNTYLSVNSCYLTLSTGGEKATAASSTITAILDPELAAQNTALVDSGNNFDTLLALQSEAQSAQTAAEVNAIAAAYRNFISAGGAHTAHDLANLSEDHDASQTLLEGLGQDAASALAACQRSE
jgi:hypothetical protein